MGGELAARAVDARADGAEGDVQRPGDVLVREIAPHVEQERVAVAPGERGEPGEQVRVEVGADRLDRRPFGDDALVERELAAFRAPLPVTGPLLARFTSRLARDGYFEEDGELWTADGTLVAQSRQLALLLPSA